MSAVLRAALESLRPRQWIKNGFVFAALVFDRQLTRPHAVAWTLAGFVLFCLLSSAVYLVNDLSDREQDRQHPRKRHRPIASGRLPLPVAMGMAVALPALLIPLAFVLRPAFGWVAAGYYGLMLLYTFVLKHIPLLDVFALAGGFLLRVEAGVTLIHVQRFSPWLYLVTLFIALFLGLGKRRAELELLATNAANHRKVLEGYTLPFLDQMINIAATATIMTYSLYTFVAPNLPSNHAMMFTIPFVVYGLFRYLYLIHVRGYGGAPEEAVLRDRPLQATVVGWGLLVLFIFYWF